MARPAASAMVHRLAAHGGWMSRAELTHGLDWAESLLDDELADLVTEGTVRFNERMREYCLGGTPWARRAMQRLVERGLNRYALVGQSRNPPGTHIGLAQRVTAADGAQQLVMAEIEMPPQPVAQMLELTVAMQAWLG